jgi:hypothetical protein
MLRSLITGSVAAVALMAASAVQAAPIDGTAGVALIGTSSDTATIGLGTTFSSDFSAISSTSGDMNAVALATLFNTSSITATVGSAVSFSAGFGAFSGTITLASAAGPVNNRTVSLYALGLFTPDGPLASFSPGPMSLTISATQTGGAGSSVSVSYSMASPPSPPRVAEPATLALLGAGLMGLAAVRRRKA